MSQPKRERLMVVLRARALRVLGDTASELDYVTDYIGGGNTVTRLALDLEAEMGESVSRNWLSSVANNLTADAKGRIETARRESAVALIDQAVAIADGSAETPGAVGKARVQVGVRQWMAEKFNPQEFGSKLQVEVSVAQLHLDALRIRSIPDAPPATALLAAVSGAAETLAP